MARSGISRAPTESLLGFTEAGDLIESRSPELAAQARTALRRYADETPRQAE